MSAAAASKPNMRPGPDASEQKTPARNLWEDFRGLKKLWPYLREHKPLIVIAVLLIPVISFLQMALPIVVKRTIDEGVLKQNYEILMYGALFYLATVVGEYASRAGQSVATSLAVHRMIKDVRQKLVGHVLSLRCAFHDKSMSGALVTRATSDFDNLSESLNMGVLTSVVDIAVLVGCVIGMFVLNWKLALCAIVFLPLVAWLVRWFSMALKSAMLKARRKIAALNAYTQECFYGHTTIKLLAAESKAQEKYDQLNVEYRDAQMSSVVLDALMFSILDGLASVTVGVVLWLGITQLTSVDTLSAGLMVAFTQYIHQLFEPLKQLGNKMAMLQGAFTSIERIFGILDLTESVAGQATLPGLKGHVRFEHVSFAYDGKRSKAEPVLKDISFELQPGESMALVGATGSGKSTVVKLLAKLYEGYSGYISIDGHDLATLDPAVLRRQMAIVPQDIVLFDGTVAFNIGLGLAGISQPQIELAARHVAADSFIKRLPGGYDHMIREHGANLSHGQRQLIAFARALARDPGLVILDEATSSVDPESEAVIQAAIARILKGRTVIVIAHRLSTIRQCDKILVIDKGRVVEDGRHEDLLANKSAYYKLHHAFA